MKLFSLDEIVSVCMYSFFLWFVTLLLSIYFPVLIDLSTAFLACGCVYSGIAGSEIAQLLIRMHKGELKA